MSIRLCPGIYFSSTLSEPRHDQTNKVAYAPNEDSDQPESDQSLRCALSGMGGGAGVNWWSFWYVCAAFNSLGSENYVLHLYMPLRA